MRRLLVATAAAVATAPALAAQATAPEPPALDRRLPGIAAAPSPERLRRDLATLVAFGTRHTLSDTVSDTRGIGAARRWIKAEFDRISASCGGCLEVRFQRSTVKGGGVARVPADLELVNVVATLKGTTHPDRYVVMSAHFDSRVSDVMDATSDAPGANDDGSGTVALLEAARALIAHRYGKSIVFAALAGEEQGLLGGYAVAREARAQGWTIEGVLNNDIIGNVDGMDGVHDEKTFRIFSEPVPVDEPEGLRRTRRFTGGEVDGPSRQLARYVERLARATRKDATPKLVYRLDRFGRGGDHRAFNDEGYPAVRLTEGHEHYDRQHQDLRTEDGIRYGDVLEGVDPRYVAKVTGVNAAVLASLAWAPPPPEQVRIRGAVSAATTLTWEAPAGPAPAGYRVYWRDTTAPTWTRSRWVGARTEVTLEGVVIDDHLFGVASVGADGNESVVQFPAPAPSR